MLTCKTLHLRYFETSIYPEVGPISMLACSKFLCSFKYSFNY